MFYPEENPSNSDNELASHYLDYLLPESSGKDSLVSAPSVKHKWQRTPRTVSDFSESKSKISSCKDSDYEAWLENYYQDLYHQHKEITFEDRQVDTSDLIPRKSDPVYRSLFPEVKKNNWTESTKYWGPKDVRRHWPLLQKRGEYLLFPTIHPHLNLTSRYGRYHSMKNTAAAVPEVQIKNVVCKSVKKGIEKLNHTQPQLQKILFCDNLFQFEWFDHMGRTSILRSFTEFLRTQHQLEKVYFENARLRKLEGIIILCALVKNGGGSQIKELHMWKMFAPDENPHLNNELTLKQNPTRESRTIANFTNTHYFQILNSFASLTHISMNYAYLANQEGDALLCIKSVRLGHLKELKLLCLHSERPFHTNPGYGIGGWSIPDGVWKRAVGLCPGMRVKMVFDNVPEYENTITFLSKSIPVSYVYLSGGMDFDFRKPWDIDSTLLELRNWYAPTLETLSLHLWHHRDLLDFVVKCKILEEFPNLLTFEFIGILKDVETLEVFCRKLSKGSYKLKTFLFGVEVERTNRKRKDLTLRRVDEIRENYEKVFQILDIDANIKTYVI